LIPGGVNSPVRAFSPYPFFTAYAKGSRIFDVDGNEYIDYCMGYGPLILGHAPEPVIEAVKAQLEKGTLYGTPTEQEVELAELICEAVPCAEMVRLVNTGTEATMSAIRAARGFTGRKRIVKFEGCYHGAHDYVLVKAGSGATTFGMPNSLGVPEETTRNTLVLPYNDVESFEKTIEQEGENIAAVIIEPVIGNAGVILPKKGYLERIRKLTKENGIVLIFDEVITGFRLAPGGAQQRFGVLPDITVLGKVIGGGPFPAGAFGGREDVMEVLDQRKRTNFYERVFHGGTYSGNPLTMRAGYVLLKELEKGEVYEKLEKLGERARRGLREALEPLGAYITGVGSLVCIHFTKEEPRDIHTANRTKDHKLTIEFSKHLYRKGILFVPPYNPHLFISAAHSQEDIDNLVEAAESFASLSKSRL
ncbi:MAG: glutamate-1-semialdehyde 2,1-aminomutase, partial [Candidatus Caldarchaeum sp.]